MAAYFSVEKGTGTDEYAMHINQPFVGERKADFMETELCN